MKKICYVTTISLTLKSFVLQTAEYLKNNGDFEITMICDNDDDFSELLPEGIRYIPVSMKRGISLDGISVIRKLVKIFKEEKFDLVQYSTPNASLYASIAAKIAKVPVRLYCQWGLVYVGFKGLKRKMFKSIEKIVCKNSTEIEPDSFGNLHFAHKEGLYPENKGRVIWNGSASGVDLGKFDISHKIEWKEDIRKKYNIPNDSFVYGFVGRVTGDKGINELLSAFKEVYLNNNNTYLMIVGNAEKTESVDNELYNWAEECPNVIFVGFTNVVEQYLSAMNVYILPSYREGFGSSVVEAEAMGVSVIATDIPGPRDAMSNGKTGLLIPTKSIEPLIKEMIRLYNDDELCKLLGKNGVEYAKSKFNQPELCSYIKKDREQLLGL